jgi:asparagine synthase (glutamine-hydrolysing)
MVPLGIWFKKDLTTLVRELLNQEEIRKMNYFNPAYIRWMMDEHFRGRRNFADKLWSLLVFQAWHRFLVMGE